LEESKGAVGPDALATINLAGKVTLWKYSVTMPLVLCLFNWFLILVFSLFLRVIRNFSPCVVVSPLDQTHFYLSICKCRMLSLWMGKAIISFWLSQFVSCSVKGSHSPVMKAACFCFLPFYLYVCLCVCPQPACVSVCVNWFMLSRFAWMWLPFLVQLCYLCHCLSQLKGDEPKLSDLTGISWGWGLSALPPCSVHTGGDHVDNLTDSWAWTGCPLTPGPGVVLS